MKCRLDFRQRVDTHIRPSFLQAFNNVLHGRWKKMNDGYGLAVLGYFGDFITTDHISPAGVIPAVLRYYTDFMPGASEDGSRSSQRMQGRRAWPRRVS